MHYVIQHHSVLKIIKCMLILLLFLAVNAHALPQDLNGAWYQVPAVDSTTAKFLEKPISPNKNQLIPNVVVARTGGHFVYLATFTVPRTGEYVVDFKNTSTIAQFRHHIYNQQQQLVSSFEGGIENTTLNPFFLRHGREARLEKGQYTLETEIISPNFLAIPEPYIDDHANYRQSIKYSNTLTLLSLGIFIGLGFYYTALAASRNRLAEGMYACFILGNFLFNCAALLVFSDVFSVHSLKWATFPILFSNAAYVVFVMALLDIKVNTKPRLYWIGVAILALLCMFMPLAIVYPHWALEFSRFGVSLFLSYGLLTAIIESRRKNLSAKRYLIAISAFFVLGLLTISLSKMNGQYTFYIEHMGLLSVSIEVIFLALVLTFQFTQLQHEKDSALKALEASVKTALSDELTGLPNRHALAREIDHIPHDGSLTFIDLDGLKFYNDTYGHAQGDALLISFAQNYQRSLQGNQKLYRLGGDEFAVLCHRGNVAEIDHALTYALDAMQQEGFAFSGASAGSVYGHEADNSASLMRIADARMYENKRARKASKHS